MNELFHNHIQKAGEDITLTPIERERMRGVLRSYMEMKPIRAHQSSAYIATRAWFFTFRPLTATLVLVLFAASGGISYAAENALPGDILYPIKTQINEPVQGALALSASAKAEWATSVAGERVKEAATLAATGRLNPATQQELQADFEAHAQQATEAIGIQASSTPDEGVASAVRFEAQLSEYQNVLAQVGAAKDVDVASLVSSVQSEGERIATVRARAESDIGSASTENSASSRMQEAAKQQLGDSSELAHAAEGSLSTSSADLVAVQLESASSSISAGEDFAAQKAIPAALGAFQNALATTEKLGVFLQTSSAIHARTGLVVGEPIASAFGRSAQRTDKDNQSSGEAKHAALMSASLLSSSTPPTATSSAAASSTTDMQNTDGASDTTSNIFEQESHDSSTTLPLSVPLHFFH